MPLHFKVVFLSMAMIFGVVATVTVTEQGHSSPGVVESNILTKEHEQQLQTVPNVQENREQATPMEIPREEAKGQAPEDAISKDTTEAGNSAAAKVRAANLERVRGAMREWREAKRGNASKSELDAISRKARADIQRVGGDEDLR